MTREQIERELRERLEAHRTPFNFGSGVQRDRLLPLLQPEVESLVSALLPWIMEIREDAAVQARIDTGQMP